AKFLDSTGHGYVSDAIDAIDYVIETKNAFASSGGANVRVMSNSWIGDPSQALLDAINRANASDILFVAAAGNNGGGNSGWDNDIHPIYPCNYNAPNVICVAATDSMDMLASFSNYGRNTVHLAAPGVGILSTVRDGRYAYYNGTSMATPHVAGAATLILSVCQLTTASLKNTLLNNVDTIASLSNSTITGGRLNVARALRACAPSGT